MPSINTKQMMNILIAFLAVATVSEAFSGKPKTPAIKIVHQFPNETWLENLAVRSKGDILVTLLTAPEIYLIDPTSQRSPTLVHRFQNVTGVFGITETLPDRFAVAVGDFNIHTGKSTRGSYSIWKLDLRGFDQSNSRANVEKVTDIPAAQFLNGVTLLNRADRTILVADSGAGNVYRVNTETGRYDVALHDSLLEPPASGIQLGVNGIHINDNVLYFTNSYKQLFGQVHINKNGKATSEFEIVKKLPTLADDFVRGRDGAFYITTDPANTLGRLASDGHYETIGGKHSSSILAGDTAGAFGRLRGDKSTLYVTTNGGIINPVNGTIVGGRLLAIDVKGLRT